MDRQSLQEESFEGAALEVAQSGAFDVAQGGHSDGSSNGNGQIPESGTTSAGLGLAPLSPAQLLAVKALRNGCSLWQAAKAAGVSRLTLHEWRVRHPEFSEVMEQWEARALTLARSRVAELAPLAADAMSDALAGENPRAATVLLRSIQVLRAFGATRLQAEAK